jgi:hypothetical protein
MGASMSRIRTPFAMLLAGSLTIAAAQSARADESGVSFWLPGLFGSFAAVPATPGWQWTSLYYHTTVGAGGGVNFPSGGQIRAGLDARADLLAFGPTYTFATPVLGAQAAVSLLGIFGRAVGSVDATFITPGGVAISGARTDSVTGFGDLYPQATLKWHKGVHNYLWYVTGDVPVGNYNPKRLANLGIGRGAIDSGVGYTYLDPQKGHEFSITTGFTYNFENQDTNYQNGVDWHVDWGASQFLSKQTFVGLVGYLYNQLGSDSGSGARLGPFHSRVASIGPQFGHIFPISKEWQGTFLLKGYWEFAAQHRAEGWNVWAVLNIAPAAPSETATPKITK